jgi:hypothetical protein
MINIVLIGAGKLGSRHLQALAKVNLDANIFVVDPSLESQKIAKSRYDEIPRNPKIHSLEFYSLISDLKIKVIDVAIIATSSEHRFVTINLLLSHAKIRFLILEKFLFQNETEYISIKEILNKKGVETWVNCPRRMWDVYKKLKSETGDSKLREFMIIGADWSLATSCIHILDLIAFLTSCHDYQIFDLDFGKEFVPAYSSVTGARESKFIEFYGSMRGKFSNGTNFTFNCLKNVSIPFQIELVFDDKNIRIFEEHGKLISMTFGENRLLLHSEQTFSYPYQSGLTNLVVEDLIHTGQCSLTCYNESMALHLPLHQCFQAYLSDILKKDVEYLPIT